MRIQVLKSISIASSIVILMAACLFAQAPEFSWSRYYGNLNDEVGYCVEQTSDGGFILSGASYNETSDAYFVKVDSNGDTLWTRKYGVNNYDDNCYSVKQIPNGSYIAAIYGFTNIMKLDTNGDSLWTRSFGGYSTHIELTSDGGYIVSSVIDDGFTLTRTDSSGNVIWQNNYSEDLISGLAHSVKLLADGGFIAVGSVYYNNEDRSRCCAVRTDSNGGVIWRQAFVPPPYANEDGYDVCQTSDGGFIILLHDFWVIKIDSNGNQMWRRFCGGNTGESAFSLCSLSDGTYLLGGTGSDLYAGYFMSNVNSDGDTLWISSFGGTWCWGLSARPTADGGYIQIGYGMQSEREDSNIRIIKFSSSTEAINNDKPIPSRFSLFQNEPNPFNASTLIRYDIPIMANVKLNIYNIAGQLVITLIDGLRTAGSHEIMWNAGNVSSGIYFARLEGNGQKQSIKMVLLK